MEQVTIRYDFHIHTCLSPCADDDMTPNNIVNMAQLAGLDAIAVTDHNSCKNCGAVIDAARREYPDMLVLPGMELTTAEEIHVLMLFCRLEDALLFEEYISERMPKIKNNPDFFGNQVIMDSNDETVCRHPYLLISATDITVDTAAQAAARFGGIAVPAHINKPQNSVMANLGFFNDEWNFKTFELFFREGQNIEEYVEKNRLMGYNYILNSDAHSLGEIGTADFGKAVVKAGLKTAQGVLKALSAGNM